MKFRKLEVEEAEKLMDYAEKHGHNYDIWDAEDLLLGVTNLVEIGVEDRVWIEFDLQNGKENET